MMSWCGFAPQANFCFADFLATYDNFYWSFALDGHESDLSAIALLAKYSTRIAPHRVIAESILSNLCADTDADLDDYKDSGRFGSSEALARLKLVVASLPSGEA
jgi:hypothetical protein